MHAFDSCESLLNGFRGIGKGAEVDLKGDGGTTWVSASLENAAEGTGGIWEQLLSNAMIC